MHTVEVKGILSANNGMNIYRGCTHGCIYCDARSNCYQMQHQFEDVEVKINAPKLLEAALRKKRKRCMLGTGAMSDPYLHYEKDLCITRKCLELINEYGYGVSLQTKSDLVLRDLDLLKEINKKTKAVVQMTLTTFDDELCKIIEPNVCVTSKRAEVLNILRSEGIPTIVWISPILPFINDTEENIKGLLNYCNKAKVYGIMTFGMGVTLRDGDRQYFYRMLDEKLNRYFPGMKEKYIKTYGDSYELLSPKNEELMKILIKDCIEHNTCYNIQELFSYMQEFTDKQEGTQLSFF